MTVASGSGSVAERTVAIVVHYGDPALTDECLQSITRGSTLPGFVVVVDNGPEPLPFVALGSIRTRHRIIHAGENLGFAAAVNRALKEVPGFDWVWLLNNDAKAEPTAFEELTESASRSGPALV